MRFMNEWDIAENTSHYARHPVKSRACRIIKDLMDLTNQVSDGWPYWSKPARSAAKLMALIEDMANPTDADLKRACAPIKAMLTKNNGTFGGRTINFD